MAKKIHEKVAPVVNWLQTADEETSEEEEDEVEVVYSESASKTGIVTETVQKPAEEEEDDVSGVTHFYPLM